MRQVHCLGVLLNSAIRQPGDLLAQHAGLASLLDLLDEGVQSRAVDAAACLHLACAVQCRREGASDLHANLACQLPPRIGWRGVDRTRVARLRFVRCMR